MLCDDDVGCSQPHLILKFFCIRKAGNLLHNRRHFVHFQGTGISLLLYCSYLASQPGLLVLGKEYSGPEHDSRATYTNPNFARRCTYGLVHLELSSVTPRRDSKSAHVRSTPLWSRTRATLIQSCVYGQFVERDGGHRLRCWRTHTSENPLHQAI